MLAKKDDWCRNFSLEFTTKAKACKRREPRMKLEKSHIMLLGSVKE